MKIAVIGINHNNTPIEIREKFAFTESKKIDAGSFLLDKSVEEVVIVSTCNRSEIYIASHDIDNAIQDVKDMYNQFFNVSNAEEYFFEKKGRDVVEHIYMVAAGVDSLVIGEDQILGQIKDAMMSSMELNFSKKVLNRLFMESLNEGKKIRSELRMSEVPISTSYIGILLLKEVLSSFEGKKALIIGAGEISKLVITYLSEERLDKLYVANRTHGRIKSLFEEFDGLTPVEYEDRYEVLKDVDILISATASPHLIINKDKVDNLDKKLCVLDLGMPRNIDSRLEEFENVVMYDLDDLNKVSRDNLKKREELSLEAKEVVRKDVDEFMTWLSSIKVDPVLKSLNERIEDIKDSRMDYINRKLDLDGRERKIVDKMILSALKSLIREPIKTLKSIDENEADEYINAANDLFGFK